MEKKCTCCFMGEKNLNDLDEYKKCCASEDKPKSEPLTKFYNKKYLFRKSLKCKMQESGENITVILMNPSFADENGLDKTLSNVRKFLEQTGKFSSFEVLNIFPIRMPESGKVKELLKKYDPDEKYQDENNGYIMKTLKKSKKVLLAWGGDENHRDAQWIFENHLLDGKELYVYRLNNDDTPKHFAPQVYNPLEKKEIIKLTKVIPYPVWYLKKKED